MQIVFKIRKQFSLSTNSQPNSKISGYFNEGSVHSVVISKKCNKEGSRCNHTHILGVT